MRKLIADLVLALYFKIEGDLTMMAMLFAQRVILGKNEFEDVPEKLKAQVAEILLDSGLPELVPEEWGGTKKK